MKFASVIAVGADNNTNADDSKGDMERHEGLVAENGAPTDLNRELSQRNGEHEASYVDNALIKEEMTNNSLTSDPAAEFSVIPDDGSKSPVVKIMRKYNSVLTVIRVGDLSNPNGEVVVDLDAAANGGGEHAKKPDVDSPMKIEKRYTTMLTMIRVGNQGQDMNNGGADVDTLGSEDPEPNHEIDDNQLGLSSSEGEINETSELDETCLDDSMGKRSTSMQTDPDESNDMSPGSVKLRPVTSVDKEAFKLKEHEGSGIEALVSYFEEFAHLNQDDSVSYPGLYPPFKTTEAEQTDNELSTEEAIKAEGEDSVDGGLNQEQFTTMMEINVGNNEETNLSMNTNTGFNDEGIATEDNNMNLVANNELTNGATTNGSWVFEEEDLKNEAPMNGSGIFDEVDALLKKQFSFISEYVKDKENKENIELVDKEETTHINNNDAGDIMFDDGQVAGEVVIESDEFENSKPDHNGSEIAEFECDNAETYVAFHGSDIDSINSSNDASNLIDFDDAEAELVDEAEENSAEPAFDEDCSDNEPYLDDSVFHEATVQYIPDEVVCNEAIDDCDEDATGLTDSTDTDCNVGEPNEVDLNDSGKYVTYTNDCDADIILCNATVTIESDAETEVVHTTEEDGIENEEIYEEIVDYSSEPHDIEHQDSSEHQEELTDEDNKQYGEDHEQFEDSLEDSESTNAISEDIHELCENIQEQFGHNPERSQAKCEDAWEQFEDNHDLNKDTKEESEEIHTHIHEQSGGNHDDSNAQCEDGHEISATSITCSETKDQDDNYTYVVTYTFNFDTDKEIQQTSKFESIDARNTFIKEVFNNYPDSDADDEIEDDETMATGLEKDNNSFTQEGLDGERNGLGRRSNELGSKNNLLENSLGCAVYPDVDTELFEAQLDEVLELANVKETVYLSDNVLSSDDEGLDSGNGECVSSEKDSGAGTASSNSINDDSDEEDRLSFAGASSESKPEHPDKQLMEGYKIHNGHTTASACRTKASKAKENKAANVSTTSENKQMKKGYIYYTSQAQLYSGDLYYSHCDLSEREEKARKYKFVKKLFKKVFPSQKNRYVVNR